MAVSHLGHDVGGGGGQQHQLSPAAQLDVRLGVTVLAPEIQLDRPARDAPEGGGTDEVRRRRRHGDPDLAAGLDQLRDQVRDLVSGDAAADQDRDPEAADCGRNLSGFQRAHARSSAETPGSVRSRSPPARRRR